MSRIVIGLGLCLLAVGFSETSWATELRVVSLNTKQLPSSPQRVERLVGLLRLLADRSFDHHLVALQEFYFNPVTDKHLLKTLVAAVQDKYEIFTGVPWHGKPEHDRYKAKLGGSGLTLLVRKDLKVLSRHAEPWRKAVFMDDIAQKGFLRVTLGLPGGQRLHLVAVHLNAMFPGRDYADLLKNLTFGVKTLPEELFLGEVVQRDQINQLAQHLETLPAGDTQLLLGDFNVISTREYPEHPFLTMPIRQCYRRMLERLKAVDLWAVLHPGMDEPGFTIDPSLNPMAFQVPKSLRLLYPDKTRIDYFLLRDPANTLRPLGLEVAFSSIVPFPNGEGFVSDHFGLLGRFAY
ncbi:MAG: hypothetical protein A2284_15545 [Deltaproteobacteria bacterium RIFOXYA12_FULL_61_11]|nr:MAG: hypothetical protein A2284_15545 [Deltaproteobacteria bacterium RIFOXYA12_FULL_61_11]